MTRKYTFCQYIILLSCSVITAFTACTCVYILRENNLNCCMQFLCHIPLDGSIYLDYNQYSSYLNQEVTFSVTFTSDGCMETDIAVENHTFTEYPDLQTWLIALHHDSQFFCWLACIRLTRFTLARSSSCTRFTCFILYHCIAIERGLEALE